MFEPDMVKTERMRNVRQVRSPENIHTPYASRSQKLISNTDRALVSIMQDSRHRNHKIKTFKRLAFTREIMKNPVTTAAFMS